jgi:UDP-N-acetylmuramyl tripeptide synthase
LAAPFTDSRRLTGHNRFFDGHGAVLESAAADTDAALLEAWTKRVQRAKARLGWPDAAIVAIPHAAGASLALAAAPDQLITATELNEWALAASLLARNPAREAELLAALAFEQPDASVPPGIEEAAALERLAARAAGEANPRLRALLDTAQGHSLPCLLDDEFLTMGAGIGGRTWSLTDLPGVADVPWLHLRAIPVALVTGTNGKTTVVRLIAACAQAEGWTTGHSCTDGLYIDGVSIEAGDYSGPAGARVVLRDRRIEAAILETARGGLLRRGLAVEHADAAVITGVSADHFGEYGVHNLETLTDVKLTVARALDGNGCLIVNAEDALLAARSRGAGKTLAWFAQDANHERLIAHRRHGGASCGVAGGRLLLAAGADEHDLGAVATLPLAAGGLAPFNIANLAAAALAAITLGIRPATIAAVFARFGADPMDNPGRLMRYELGGLHLVVDFAHNPAALTGLLELAGRLRGGRLALLLGQAGNRADVDMECLARVAVAAQPDLVVIKELAGYRRGRGEGEVPNILRRALHDAGLPDTAIREQPDELAAARTALAWARAGDVLVLPLHSRSGRTEVLALLSRMRQKGWTAGKAVPA